MKQTLTITMFTPVQVWYLESEKLTEDSEVVVLNESPDQRAYFTPAAYRHAAAHGVYLDPDLKCILGLGKVAGALLDSPEVTVYNNNDNVSVITIKQAIEYETGEAN